MFLTSIMYLSWWRHAKERDHCCRGKPGSTLSSGYAPDSARAEGGSIIEEPDQGSAKALCARIKGAKREIFEGKADL